VFEASIGISMGNHIIMQKVSHTTSLVGIPWLKSFLDWRTQSKISPKIRPKRNIPPRNIERKTVDVTLTPMEIIINN